ncbi:hypothetical protein D3C81_2040840 [compost metagenome]
MVAARLESDIGSRPFRFLSRHAQGVNFSMRFAGTVMRTFPDNFALFDNHTADTRIRVSGKTPLSGQL